MDPTATYDELADLTNQVLSGCEVEVEHMAGLFESLDLWLKNGGYRPAAWNWPDR